MADPAFAIIRDGLPRLLQSSSEFVAGFKPPDYVIDGILQRGFIYSFTGRTGSGKTAIMLLIAAFVALAKAIGLRLVQQGRVLYFAGENPDDIRMRWIAMSAQISFDIDRIPVHFIPGVFRISELFDRIEKEVAEAGPFVLIVIDTSAAYYEGDDINNNVQQGVHARRLRSLNRLKGSPCILVGCHPVKNAAADNLLPIGGGAFLNEVDGNLTASAIDGGTELHWQGKFRGPDFPPMSFRLSTVMHDRLVDSRGRAIPTVMASHLSDEAKEEMAVTARSNENRLLAVLTEDGSASLADLARKLGWSLKTGEPHKMMVKRARDRLASSKLITLERDTVTVTDKGKKLLGSGVTANGTAWSANGHA